MQLFFGPRSPRVRAGESLEVGDRRVPLEFVRHRRARRYVLRLSENGTARVTVPWCGSLTAARAFAQSQTAWLTRQFLRRAVRPLRARHWLHGTTILFRGASVELSVEAMGERMRVRFADQLIEAPSVSEDVRPAVEAHLQHLAEATLPPRVLALAAADGLQVRRVAIRDQRSRWGSCSRTGTVSLNWRLIQMPESVRDYVIWHELMHLREMNHSPRFWRHVAAVCPEYETARRWLRAQGAALR